MEDPIYERYKARQVVEQEARATEVREKQEADEQERLRLLATVEEELDRAFERLEEIEYIDEVVYCMFRKVREGSGEISEAATWSVGRSRPWQWTREDTATDHFYLSSDRRFWRSKGEALPDPSATHVLLDLADLHLDELQGVMAGLSRVGARRDRPGTGWRV